jgi:hypothetical protein
MVHPICFCNVSAHPVYNGEIISSINMHFLSCVNLR